MTARSENDLVPSSLKRRFARVAGWLSLIGSAIGILNLAKDLVPTLTRLSLLTKGVFALYHIIRDGAWQGLRIALGWIHIAIPDIPPIWKDGIVIASLIFAALNFESLRKHQESLVAPFARSLRSVVTASMPNVDGVSGLFRSEGEESGWLLGLSLLIGITLDGYLVLLVLRSTGVDFWVGRWLDPLLPAAAIGGVIFFFLYGSVIMTALMAVDTRSSRVWLVLMRILIPFSIPLIVVNMILTALVNGWRSVLLALGVVAMLVGLNYAFLLVIDPLLVHPPAWLQQLIDADPSKLPKPQ